MENKIKNNLSFSDKIIKLIKSKSKFLIIILSIIFIITISLVYLSHIQEKKNEKISQKYIAAGVYLSNNDKDKSKEIYKEIIISKHNFYSPLSLNIIIDKELEKNNDELIKLFEIIESIKMEKEQKNLIKLKKALYLLKISKIEQGKKLLEEIISENSKWKDLALKISK